MTPSHGEHPTISPPIAFIDEGGGVGPLFASVDELIDYLEWPVQFQDEPAEACDCAGRHLTLVVEDGRVVVSGDPSLDPTTLETLLRSIVSEQPSRFGLLDADVDLDTLMRALWPRARWGKGPYPSR